jgi:predicted peptidase
MNILAIHRVMEEGERNVAMVLEYPKAVVNAALEPDAFSVSDRTILRVYSNDQAAQAIDESGRDGPYVVVEMDPKDEASASRGRSTSRSRTAPIWSSTSSPRVSIVTP